MEEEEEEESPPAMELGLGAPEARNEWGGRGARRTGPLESIECKPGEMGRPGTAHPSHAKYMSRAGLVGRSAGPCRIQIIGLIWAYIQTMHFRDLYESTKIFKETSRYIYTMFMPALQN